MRTVLRTGVSSTDSPANRRVCKPLHPGVRGKIGHRGGAADSGLPSEKGEERKRRELNPDTQWSEVGRHRAICGPNHTAVVNGPVWQEGMR